MELLVNDEMPIQLAATITPTTAAKSSNNTTFTLGSCPRNTEKKKKYFCNVLNVFTLEIVYQLLFFTEELLLDFDLSLELLTVFEKLARLYFC